jgi:hypothetical protein
MQYLAQQSDGSYIVNLSPLEMYDLVANEIEATEKFQIWISEDAAEEFLTYLLPVAKQFSLKAREKKILCLVIQEKLLRLSSDERKALELKFGLTAAKHTLRQVAEALGATEPNTAKKIIHRSLRHLRHPIRTYRLRPFQRILENGADTIEDEAILLVQVCLELLGHEPSLDILRQAAEDFQKAISDQEGLSVLEKELGLSIFRRVAHSNRKMRS